MQDWFKHDFNAPEDEKLNELYLARGYTGIGMYWTLIAHIGRANERRISREHFRVIAFKMHITISCLNTFIELLKKINLVREENGFIFSSGMLKRMKMLDKKRGAPPDDPLMTPGAPPDDPLMTPAHGGVLARKSLEINGKNPIDKSRIDKSRLEQGQPRKRGNVRELFLDLFSPSERANMLLVEKWTAWANARPKKLTRSIAEARLQDCRGWGEERAIAALHHSIGYQGIFEPRTGRVPATGPAQFEHSPQDMLRIYAENKR